MGPIQFIENKYLKSYQYWHMTNVDPPTPIKNRMAARPDALLTRPVSAVGTALAKRMIPMGILGPYCVNKNAGSNTR